MTGARLFFLLSYGLMAFVGLFLAAAARDVRISVFGRGLLLFGVSHVGAMGRALWGG